MKTKYRGYHHSVMLFAWVMLLVLTGCTPSISQVVDMRKTSAAWAASGDFKTLLACMRGVDAPADPSKHRHQAIWRVQALATLHELDRRFDYAAHRPEYHRSLFDVTYDEYRKTAARDDQDHVRAWAVHFLGEMSPPLPVEDFVHILGDTTSLEDPQGRIRLAALGALADRLDEVARDEVLRQRVLYHLAGIAGELQAGDITGGRREDIAVLGQGVRRNLTDYHAVVDLLSTSVKEDDTARLLEVLTWNYQQLKVGAQRSPEGALAFKKNVATLLGLLWHEQATVRGRSRLILAEFAPAELHQAILARLVDPALALAEDYLQLIVLTLAIDRSRAAGEEWKDLRRRAFAAVFAAWKQLDVEQREVILGKMLAGDPAELAARLAEMTLGDVGEAEAAVGQYVRYVRHVYKKVDLATAAILASPVARFMQHPALAVRQQVAAALSDRSPVTLALSAARVMQRDTPDAAEAGDYVVQVYIDTLTRLEAVDGMASLEDPYQVFRHGMARPNWPAKASIAKFLDSRDPELLVRLLAADISNQLQRGAKVDARQWCLLGDVTQAHAATLKKPTRALAVETLSNGLDDDGEASLFCARYLLELGESPANMDGSDALRAMAEMAASAERNRKP